MSMISSEVLSIITNIFGEAHRHTRTNCQISYHCPVCDDGGNKGNLEINYSKLVMKCWKCSSEDDGLKGSLRKLVQEYGNRRDLKMYDDITEDYRPEYTRKEFDENYKPYIKLPKEYIKLSTAKNTLEYKQAMTYLKGRELTNDIIEKYEIGFCCEGDYSGRIIIPSYDVDGDLNYFVGRSYVGHKQTYKNPDVEKTQVIINNLSINWDSTIYIVEGMFDMIGLGIDNCIPLLGKVLHDKLYLELIRKSKGYIVLLLDPDAKINMYRIYQKLQNTLELHDRIRVIDLPLNMDIADIRTKYKHKGVVRCLKRARKLKLEDFTKNGL